MNDVGGSSRIRNATILMVFAGAFYLYLGYTFFQISIIMHDPIQSILGTLMIVFGVLTFCTSLIVWRQNPWVTKIIAGIGIAICGVVIIFGAYLMIIIIAPIYWVTINQFRQGIVYADWQEN
ncbi:MAG: hypothetical protein RTU63_10865 [Candidatus Thorarchaeota archaeon]